MSSTPTPGLCTCSQRDSSVPAGSCRLTLRAIAWSWQWLLPLMWSHPGRRPRDDRPHSGSSYHYSDYFEEAAEYAFTGKGMLNASDLDKVDTSAKRLAEEMHHAEDVSVVSLVDNILETALKRRASDIHFEPQLYEMVVRIRIDGVMHPLTQIPNDTKGGVVSRSR